MRARSQDREIDGAYRPSMAVLVGRTSGSNLPGQRQALPGDRDGTNDYDGADPLSGTELLV